MSQRILIVENNKTLAKLLSKKIRASLDFEVDMAYSMIEAKLFLKRYKYFISIVDIDLQDSQKGEIVEYVIEKKIPILVLGANINKNFKQELQNKNIIDFIDKGGLNDINYIVQTLKRLYQNQNHTILLVDDSMVFRKQMQNMLKNLFFNVIAVAHGEEAISIMNTNSNISLILTDYNMPVMDGLELTYEIRKTYAKNDLSILAISSDNNDEINAKFLKHGANDYIKKPFSKEEFYCRINNSIEALENIQLVTNHANRDYLTGLYNRRFFINTMNEYANEIEGNGEKFAIAMINIDSFKDINENYNHEIGDKVIISLSEILRSSTSYRDVVARFSGDEFCVVLKNINRYSALDILQRLKEEVEKFMFNIDKENYIQFTISIGAVVNTDDGLDENISQADMLLYKAKKSGKNQVIFE